MKLVEKKKRLPVEKFMSDVGQSEQQGHGVYKGKVRHSLRISSHEPAGSNAAKAVPHHADSFKAVTR